MSAVVIPTISVASRPARQARRIATVWWVSTVVIIMIIAALALMLASGGRFLMVKTPSMGQAAPVGSLLVERPVAFDDVRRGDIVTFAVEERPGITYTHRVIGENADGSLSTRGDANGAIDPWPLTSETLLGAPVVIVPAAGWAITALPVLLIGSMLIWMLTSAFTDRVTRSSLRLAGASLVFAYASFLYKPFVNLVTLTSVTSSGAVDATVVSTGILPIRAIGPGDAAVTLQPGQVGHLHIHDLAHNGYYQVASNLHLSWAGWLIIAAICAAPLVVAYAIGHRRSGDFA